MNPKRSLPGQNGAVKREKVTIDLGGIVIRVDEKTGQITNPKTVAIQFNRAAAGLINKSNQLPADHVSENLDLTASAKHNTKKPLNFEQVENLDLEWIEFWIIIEALERTLFVQADAAVLLGTTARALNYKIRKHGIKNSKWTKNKLIT